jgi:hypothetical protein
MAMSVRDGTRFDILDCRLEAGLLAPWSPMRRPALLDPDGF